MEFQLWHSRMNDLQASTKWETQNAQVEVTIVYSCHSYCNDKKNSINIQLKNAYLSSQVEHQCTAWWMVCHKKSYCNNHFGKWKLEGKKGTCRGESPDSRLTPVTEQPMMRPWRRTPRYHFGPILFNLISLKPAFLNHSMYSSSLGNNIHISAKKRDSQKVGYTGPMIQANPPSFSTRYASLMPRWGSGQYSMLQIDRRESNWQRRTK